MNEEENESDAFREIKSDINNLKRQVDAVRKKQTILKSQVKKIQVKVSCPFFCTENGLVFSFH